MHDGTLALLTLIFFGSELALALFRRSKSASGATRADHGSVRVLWIVITLAITMGFTFSGPRPGFLPFSPRTARIVAFPLFGLGLALRWWAIITLGKFFTIDVATHADHALVDTGPFRFVRHPSYTGLLMAFAAFGVSLGNVVSLLALLVPILVALAYRIRVEEQALHEALGPPYAAYCARTKRLIPGLV